MDDIVFRTASELARSIRQGEVSATEVLEAHLRQIEAHNPRLNAVVTLDTEGARLRARQADEALAQGENWGPLHGVPVTFKDVFETAGLRTTSSFKPLANHIPQQDAVVVKRLRQAGAVILGKTNLPEMAGDEQTDSPLFGRTHNPWNLERTPGGSSGGSGGSRGSRGGCGSRHVASGYRQRHWRVGAQPGSLLRGIQPQTHRPAGTLSRAHPAAAGDTDPGPAAPLPHPWPAGALGGRPAPGADDHGRPGRAAMGNAASGVEPGAG